MVGKEIIPRSENIDNRIYTVRNMQVLLDEDLADLYDVETKALNQAVKRNRERFPGNFMFQLTKNEFKNLKSQVVTSTWGGRRALPYAFTEQGVAMLSGILKSQTAVRTSIRIMNAFVAMRRCFHANSLVFHRLDMVERRQAEHDEKFDELFDAIQDKSILPEKGIFFDGQVFDAHTFISDIIRRANTSIILIDNYVDDSVLTLFSKRSENVQVTIFTREISKQLSLDVAKYDSQYPAITIKEFNLSHDRFLILDNKEVYHIGASLKDLGKKWFAFSKFDKDAVRILEKLT